MAVKTLGTVSKKASRIVSDTRSAIVRDVRRGFRYDALSRTVHIDSVYIGEKTVKDMMTIVQNMIGSLETERRRYERHPEDAERWPSLYERFVQDVEVARRLYLTIDGEKRRVDAERDYREGKIDFDEYIRITF